MTIATPAALTVAKTIALLSAPADAEPLKGTLENAAHMYAAGPAHMTCVFTCADKIASRSARFEIPIHPSQDGLPYVFRHHCRTGTGTSNLNLTVEEWTGGAWNTLEVTTAISAGADTVVTYTHTDTIAAAATKLRITWARTVGFHQFTPDSLCIYPAVAAIGAGKTTAGHVPFDDGLLTTTGAPIHTELFNRAVRNALSALQDRRQCALAFVQEDGTAGSGYVKHEVSTAGLGAGVFARMGAARFSCPHQVNPQITIYVLASVSGGTTSDIVRVQQNGPQGTSTLLAASGSVVMGTLTLATPGGPGSHVDLEVLATHPAGNEAYVHAVVAYWQPGG